MKIGEMTKATLELMADVLEKLARQENLESISVMTTIHNNKPLYTIFIHSYDGKCERVEINED